MNTCRHDKAILTGDLNLPGIDWSSSFLNTKNCEHASYLFDIMTSQNMHQIVSQPTRVHGASASLLDQVFITRSVELFSVSVEPGLSDNYVVYFSCPMQAVCATRHAKSITVKDFSRANDESVLDYLDLSLSSFQGTDPEKLWNKFKEICLQCLDNFVPSKVKKTRKSNPWITRDVLHMERKLKRLKRKGAPRNITLSAQDKLNEAVRIAKFRYFQDTLPNFLTSAPQIFWNFLSKKTNCVEQIPHEGETIVDKKTIANHFNLFFHNVFSASNKPLHQFSRSNDDVPNILSLPVIVSLLLNLKTKTSTSPDQIHNTFLRRCAEMLSEFLIIIFRASIRSGRLPRDWKVGRIAPVHKKGDKDLVPNYRPISITSSSCKVLEHIIAKFIITFLNDNNIL
nr:uncharacterized protein LOC119177747 [Rhipicephalus microplus]XP_037284821.1 uncharacterized protein LOC119177747 [Rhipicephalus microplus]